MSERSEAESKDLERKGLGFVGKDMKTKQIDPSTRLRSLRMTYRGLGAVNNNLSLRVELAGFQIYKIFTPLS